jgi:hypothetical protein
VRGGRLKQRAWCVHGQDVVKRSVSRTCAVLPGVYGEALTLLLRMTRERLLVRERGLSDPQGILRNFPTTLKGVCYECLA